MTIKEILDSGNMGLGFNEALGIKMGIGSVLAGPVTETYEVGDVDANIVYLASKALVIQSVFNDTSSKSHALLPEGEVPVEDVSVAVSEDQITLTFIAANDGDTVKVTYIPVAEVTAEFK